MRQQTTNLSGRSESGVEFYKKIYDPYHEFKELTGIHVPVSALMKTSIEKTVFSKKKALLHDSYDDSYL